MGGGKRSLETKNLNEVSEFEETELQENSTMTAIHNSFFKYAEEIHNELINDIRQTQCFGASSSDDEIQDKLNELLLWLRKTPTFTTIRVNTLKSQSETVINHLNNSISHLPTISAYSNVPELIVVGSNSTLEQSPIVNTVQEVIVDAACGAAVLRGSNVFAPGVMGLTYGARVGDEISVFADITGQCKKGLAKKYENDFKLFVGNGILEQCRDEIFLGGNKGSGVAICMKRIASGLCQLGNEQISNEMGLLQNLPSIVCSRILDPQPGETILDMCAAPGNKTTHLAALMNNQGILIAIDKVKSKIPIFEKKCRTLGCENVKIFCFNSINSVASKNDLEVRKVTDGPPFAKAIFDRILLDGPCSALGQRPQLFNKIRANELRSFISLQRKLFATAVELLKPGGVLVYSTCTITIAENEGIVSWAKTKYPSMKLISLEDKCKLFGLDDFFHPNPGCSTAFLSNNDAKKVLRWGPGCDTVGFFIAAFRKNAFVNEENE